MENSLKYEIDKSIKKLGLGTNLSFLYSKFRKNNACEYCLLRSLQIYKQEFFNLNLLELRSILKTLSLGMKSIVDNRTNNNESDGEPFVLNNIKCRFCYNILDDVNIKTYIVIILNSFKVEKYDNNKIEIGLLFSLNLTMVDYLLKLFFEKTTNSKAANIIELKSIVRFKIIHQLQRSSKHKINCNKFTEITYLHGGSLEVNIALDQLEHTKNYLKLLEFKKKTKQMANFKWSKSKLMETLSKMTLGDLEQASIYPPPVDYRNCPSITSLTWSHKPVYLAGRYLKLDRATSQTPFFVGSRKLCEHSVSNSFKPALSQFKASSYNMVPSGREDMDVRMLGSGRPFYLEIKNPKLTNINSVNFKGLQALINKVHPPVEVRELCGIRANQLQTIKVGEETKSKYYRALIWCAKSRSELNLELKSGNLTPLNLRQGTPVRVSHRRAAANRPKNIYEIKVFPLSDHLIQVDIHAQAGTYIKELVHGDLGRTQPNLSSLIGCDCELLELDVIHVDLNWPPSNSTLSDVFF